MSRTDNKIRLIYIGLVMIILLLLSVTFLPPATHAQNAVAVDLNVEKVSVNQLGVVNITGTLTCSGPVAFVHASAGVTQPVGRFKTLNGFGSISSSECAGEVPFTILVHAEAGRFGPGIAYIDVFAQVCDAGFFICDQDNESLNTRLRRSK